MGFGNDCRHHNNMCLSGDINGEPVRLAGAYPKTVAHPNLQNTLKDSFFQRTPTVK